ncbi:hypothetical protein SPAN111604_14890 [Sphingomonas antarctica]
MFWPERAEFIGIEHLMANEVEQIPTDLEKQVCNDKGK